MCGVPPVNHLSRTSFLNGVELIHRSGNFPGYVGSLPEEEIAMTRLRHKAQARTLQIVGQMIGDDKLVQEGKQKERQAEQETNSSDRKRPAPDSQL
jgi:hypothetical protein